MVHEWKAPGKMGSEIRSLREGRKGIVREVEVGVRLDLDIAKRFVAWLEEKIDEAEKLQQNVRRDKKGKRT
jgi:hypothetical protein